MKSTEVLSFTFTLAIFQGTSSATTCPTGCTCAYRNNRYSATCVGASLTDVPEIRGSVMTLSLDENDFGTNIVADDYFYDRHLDSLRTLSIRRAHVRTLGANVFRNMELLESLDLSDNALTELPAGMFAELTHLKTLNLAGNQLTQITATLFDGATGLQSVDLSRNHITFIGVGSWRNLPRLHNINLAHNRLNKLDEHKFEAVDTTLQILVLEGNQWQCDCGLAEFVQWHARRGFEPAKCYAPARLSGKMWNSLSYEEFACAPTIDRHKIVRQLQPSIGDSVTIHCKVAGQPEPNVLFEHSRPAVDERSLIPGNQSAHKYDILRSVQAGNLFHWSLTIKSVSEADSGQYFCTASNRAATTFEVFTVQVLSGADAGSKATRHKPNTTMNITADTVLMLVVLVAAILIVLVVLGAVCCYRKTSGAGDSYLAKTAYQTNASGYHYTAIEAANGKPYVSEHCPHHHHKYSQSHQQQHYLASTPGAEGGPINCLPPPPPPPSTLYDMKHTQNGYLIDESVPSSVQQDDSGYLEPHDSPRLCSLHSHCTNQAPLAHHETDVKIPLKETSL